MNKKAYYGQFGGQYVAESLMNTLQELDQAYEEAIHDPEFMKQYHYYLKQYVGRETPLYYAERLSEKYGTKIYLKREDLNHTGAHKINNVIGQILLAKRMGKTKVIAETGAGQHGVATATGAALFDMECTVYMGKEDIQRQKLNVMRMEMLGAKVVSVESGSNTLKDATNEAIRTWAKTAEDTFYIIGSAVGPYPYPKMVKEFQSVISREAKRQHMEAEGKNPDVVMACVGGGSNSIGMFADFIDEPEVELKRNELAEYFGCAPSQINYVLATRFSPDHGYLIESRRGGGGYIRIVRIVQSGAQQLMYLINERIGDAIGEEEASRLVQQLTEQKLVTAQEAALMRAAMSAQALAIPIPDSMKDAQRARIFKAMLTSIARQNRTMP